MTIIFLLILNALLLLYNAVTSVIHLRSVTRRNEAIESQLSTQKEVENEVNKLNLDDVTSNLNRWMRE